MRSFNYQLKTNIISGVQLGSRRRMSWNVKPCQNIRGLHRVIGTCYYKWIEGILGKQIFVHTVRLLTHVLCKLTLFFFNSFIATMSYSLQTSFIVLWKTGPINTVYGVSPRSHLQGQTRDNSNTRFYHTKKKHIYSNFRLISPSVLHEIWW